MDPVKLHLVLNHLPIIGLAFAIVPLLMGLLGKSRGALAAGMVLALLGAGPIPLIMWSGEEAEHEWLYQPSVLAEIGPAGKHWADEHEERAELGSKVIYVTAGLAVLGLLTTVVSVLARGRQIVGWITLGACVLSVGVAVWIADAGGQIRHSELRGPEPPTAPADHDSGEEQ